MTDRIWLILGKALKNFIAGPLRRIPNKGNIFEFDPPNEDVLSLTCNVGKEILYKIKDIVSEHGGNIPVANEDDFKKTENNSPNKLYKEIKLINEKKTRPITGTHIINIEFEDNRLELNKKQSKDKNKNTKTKTAFELHNEKKIVSEKQKNLNVVNLNLRQTEINVEEMSYSRKMLKPYKNTNLVFYFN